MPISGERIYTIKEIVHFTMSVTQSVLHCSTVLVAFADKIDIYDTNETIESRNKLSEVRFGHKCLWGLVEASGVEPLMELFLPLPSRTATPPRIELVAIASV